MFSSRPEGFSCGLDVLYEGPKISKLQFLITKINKKFSAVLFLQLLVIKTLDPDPEPEPYPESLAMLDPDPDQ
jgi:hypothetical protein